MRKINICFHLYYQWNFKSILECKVCALTFKDQDFNTAWKEVEYMAIDIFMWLMICGMYLCKIPEIASCIGQKNPKQQKLFILMSLLVTIQTLVLKLPRFLERNSSQSNLVYFLLMRHLYSADIWTKILDLYRSKPLKENAWFIFIVTTGE